MGADVPVHGGSQETQKLSFRRRPAHFAFEGGAHVVAAHRRASRRGSLCHRRVGTPNEDRCPAGSGPAAGDGDRRRIHRRYPAASRLAGARRDARFVGDRPGGIHHRRHPVGTAAGKQPALLPAFQPSLEFIRTIPSIAALPLLILLLGTRGLSLAAAMAFLGAVWPIVIQTMYGVRDVDPMTKDAGRAMA